MILFLAGAAFADRSSEIQDLKLEKEKLNSEIQKLNRQIAATDSMLKADDSRYKTLQQRYKDDTKNRSENVAAKRKALRSALSAVSRQLESQVAQTLPWERDTRLDRVKSLTRDIEGGNAGEEEAFSRLKSLIAEETRFGDEVAIINSPLTRKNGELINASILRIGNQWMVYSDENGTVFGSLVRRMENGNVVYEWNEDLNLEERAAVKLAIDVKQAKKPPQVVKLPVSLSVVGGEK